MNRRQGLRDIEERKYLLVAKADLQRSTFRMLAGPVFRAIQAAEAGVFAVRLGQSVVRRLRR